MNRLAEETSPYLLQHAGNPVDWYPWGEEAFARARAEDKPVLLSVGYSACHWCHVMERESFEDEATAQLMNELFVSIKVDREERPDIDSVYMGAVVALSGHGGWPMTVFLTPEGEPFYGGTYYPPEPRHGMPAFQQLLVALAEAYRTQRDDVAKQAEALVDALQRNAETQPSSEPLTDELMTQAVDVLRTQYDPQWGGFGRAPKFPPASTIEFLLRRGAFDMALGTLDGMRSGGMYDLVGGGFHRYSVDAHWLVPHFEKMLYDNGQLASLYLHGWLAFGDPECRRVCEETLDYILREMTDPAGGFYSSQDADSEGHEGKFFVWTPDELREVLGAADAEYAGQCWGVDRGPNFEGKSILYVAEEPDPLRIAAIKKKLYDAREQRIHPGRDDKVLASWNGLACRAFAEAGRALGRPDYIAAAVKNAELVLGAMRADGRLLRTWKSGRAKLKGYLEDYAMVAMALLEVYEATALTALRPMADLMARHSSGFGRFLCALDFHLGPVVEVALVAPAAGDGLGALVAEVFGRYLPNRVVTGVVSGDGAGAAGIPLLQGREAVGGKATAYVCRNYVCELPVTDRAALARQLEEA